MPVVSDVFSAYPVSVTLDGSGNGTVGFQAVGANIVITKLFAKVATAGNQAVVTMYKQQIGDQFAIDNSNSGSTGASASGSIGLMDGETVYVRWTGGDAGAVATATFSGKKVPFDQAREIEFSFTQPFAAGDGTIIFPALQSENFVTSVSGWKLSRDGNLEAANIVARGTFFIPGPNGTYIFAYVASVTTPVGTATIPVIDFQGDDADAGPGSIYVYTDSGYSLLEMNSPPYATDDPSRISLRSSTSGDTTTAINLDASYVIVKDTAGITGGNLLVGPNQTDIGRGFFNGVSVAADSAAIAAETIILTLPSTTYKAGRMYRLDVAGNLGASGASSPLLQVRKTNLAGAIVKSMGRIGANGAGGGDFAPPPPVYFYVVTTDVTAVLVVTAQTNAGTVTHRGGRGCSVWDVGIAQSSLSNLAQLT